MTAIGTTDETITHSLDQVDGHPVDRVEDITFDLNSPLIRWVLSSLADLVEIQGNHAPVNLEATVRRITLEYVLDTCGDSVIDTDKMTVIDKQVKAIVGILDKVRLDMT